ncbi:hypothetical protein IV494_08140 [Kaistella sp. G5-32]|uniref:DUF4292 domain-containing protein n=1 Tax=Kaistella gelatinilytica TaxID=2787636 RepID=A0ABS0FBQ6_9FLAO|nr:hypothetical protein [Kaistella gelatinilytica]MBF8457152.1 hypothetical protein [Kaistella gelatinilytica]
MKTLIILLLIIASCTKSKKASEQLIESKADKVHDTVKFADMPQESGKQSLYTLLNQKVKIINVENRENLDIFNGFNGLKIGKHYSDFFFDSETKILLDTNVGSFNYKEVQFIPKSINLKSGTGSIMFINLIFVNNLLEKISVNQTESWQINKAEYETGNFSRGLKFNSFIQIFRSAFGDPDSFEYFISGRKPQKILGDFDDNINKIHKQYNKTQNNNELTSIDLEWKNNRLIYFLSVSPKDLSYLSPDDDLKTISLSSYLLIQNKNSKEIINKITHEIAEKENLARDKNRKNKLIQLKKNSIQTL